MAKSKPRLMDRDKSVFLELETSSRILKLVMSIKAEWEGSGFETVHLVNALDRVRNQLVMGHVSEALARCEVLTVKLKEELAEDEDEDEEDDSDGDIPGISKPG